MKRIFLAFALIAFTISMDAQRVSKDEVPAPVTAAFAKSYPAVKNVDWHKDGEFYDACYNGNNEDHTVTIDANGVIMSSAIKLTKDKELPAGIKEYVSAHYPGHEIKQAEKVTSSSGVVTYEIEINDMDVMFDEGGKFLSERKDIK